MNVLIIAGSRDFPRAQVEAHLSTLRRTMTEVVSGMASGPDTFGLWWAEKHGIPVRRMPAEWAQYGRRAGPMRNERMLDYACAAGGALLAFWDGKSKGTRHMIEIARQRGLPTRVVMREI